jgi:lysophospholipase L1-like esterase
MQRLRRGVAYAAAGGAGVLTAQMWWIRYKFRLPPDAQGPHVGVCTPPHSTFSTAPSSPTAPPKNIIFVGDSLVTGVGCSAEASALEGPVLPRRVAELLAQELGVSVRWRVLGETGASVSKMQAAMLPTLCSEAERARSAGERVDAVVVMTGLNDIKDCLLFANFSLHPWKFALLLSSLLGSIRESVGEQCSLVVSGVPIDAVPRFNEHWPFSAACKGITRLWEAKKKEATQMGAHAGSYLEPPLDVVECLRSGAGTVYFAADGMHPNDAGYALWAELLAHHLLSDMRQHQQLDAARSSTVSRPLSSTKLIAQQVSRQ